MDKHYRWYSDLKDILDRRGIFKENFMDSGVLGEVLLKKEIRNKHQGALKWPKNARAEDFKKSSTQTSSSSETGAASTSIRPSTETIAATALKTSPVKSHGWSSKGTSSAAKKASSSESLKKTEDERGMTKYDLGEGFSLHHVHSDVPQPHHSQFVADDWKIFHESNPKRLVGSLFVATDGLVEGQPATSEGIPSIRHAEIHGQFKGRGLGQKAYKALAAHYGGLRSDPTGQTSADAARVWGKVGGEQGADKKWALASKGSPVTWNNDLEKTRKTDRSTVKSLEDAPPKVLKRGLLDTVESKEMGSGIWHHRAWSKYPSFEVHVLSNSPHPHSGDAIAELNGYREGEGFRVATSKVQKDLQRQGYGTKIYRAVLDTHKVLRSDGTTSTGADGVWKNLLNQQGVTGSLGRPGKSSSPHEAKLDDLAKGEIRTLPSVMTPAQEFVHRVSGGQYHAVKDKTGLHLVHTQTGASHRLKRATFPEVQRTLESLGAYNSEEPTQKDTIGGLNKTEDEHGSTMYDLGDGYSLHYDHKQPGDENIHRWLVHHEGNMIGAVEPYTPGGQEPYMSFANLNPDHRGRGVGTKIYRTLATHYGSLESDHDVTSEGALKVWDKVGARKLADTNSVGDRRRRLEGDSSKPPIRWNDDLAKGARGDWQTEGYTLEHQPNKDGTSSVVMARAPNGALAGNYSFSVSPNNLYVSWAKTQHDHSRKGLASAAYQLVEQHYGKKIAPEKELQTQDAQALWEQPNRPFSKLQKSDYWKDFDTAMHKQDFDGAMRSIQRAGNNGDNFITQLATSDFPLDPQRLHRLIDHVEQRRKRGDEYFGAEALGEIADHQNVASDHLNRIARIAPDDGYVESRIINHPKYQPTSDDQGLLKAGQFWRSYERMVTPHHFAAVKSWVSGKPETFDSHRTGDTHALTVRGESHGNHLITGEKAQIVAGGGHQTGDDWKPGQDMALHEAIPHLDTYAKEVQKKLLADEFVQKRYFKDKPYVKVYRGVAGDYAKRVRDAAGYDPETHSVEDKSVSLKNLPFSSWSTDPKVAGRFAHREIEGHPPKQGAVVSAWLPLEHAIHSGYHSVLAGQSHAHPSESEVVFKHPTPTTKVSTKGLSFVRPEHEYSDSAPAAVRPKGLMQKSSDASIALPFARQRLVQANDDKKLPNKGNPREEMKWGTHVTMAESRNTHSGLPDWNGVAKHLNEGDAI